MDTNDWLDSGIPSPAIGSITAIDGQRRIISVEWAAGRRRGRRDDVDLSPLIDIRRFYCPLRNDTALFETVRVVDDGFAVVWGGGAIDMSASSIEHLAEEASLALIFPGDVLDRIDRYAEAHGLTRSGFLMQAAERAMVAG
jgi:hypothetical protein